MWRQYHDVRDLRFLKEMGKLAPTEFDACRGRDEQYCYLSEG
jgi:hypothetical protein